MLEALIRIELLGQLRILHGDRIITRFRTYKTGVLLAYLAFYGARSHPREELIELLWTNCDPVLGRNSLSQSLSSLRRQLEPPGTSSGTVLIADRATVQLNPKCYATDVEEFEAACLAFRTADSETDRSRTFNTAEKLYRGDLLPGYYEDWNLLERDRLQNLFQDVLVRRTEQLEKLGDLSAATACAVRSVESDALNEQAHLRLIRIYASSNKNADALKQFGVLSKTLADELGLRPSREAQLLMEKIKLGSAALTPGSQAIEPRPSDAAFDPVTSSPGIWAVLVADCPEKVVSDAFAKWIRRYNGTIVESVNEYIAAAFPQVSAATECATRLQRELDRSEQTAGEPACPRMALAVGEVGQKKQKQQLPPMRRLIERSLALLEVANRGQFICSGAAAAMLQFSSDPNICLQELGSFRMPNDDREQMIFQIDHQSRPRREFAPIIAADSSESNLPITISRFFGRETEIAGLDRWLDPGSDIRLVTVTGPGGTGKTRLSLEAARPLRPRYQNALWFVPLAQVAEPGLLPTAVLSAMGLQAPPSTSPKDHLRSVLSRKPTLLLLDNFEHWLSANSPTQAEEASDIVRQLLEQVPTLKCLITSRKRVGVIGEKEFPLEPLPIPGEEEALAAVSLCESVQLFVDRAQSVRPDFQLTRANAPVVSEICRRLEGIPLALELAAAQIQVLTASQILAGLARRLDFLTDRRRQSEARHRQLRGTIDWSFQMLTADVQRFFAALSVFRGGGDLAHVEIVCDEPLALDYLAQLQDFSFLRVEENRASADMRFRLLETLREYGNEKLAVSARDRFRARHATHFLQVAEDGGPFFKSSEQSEWLERFEKEHQNLLTALDYFIEISDSRSALRLVIALRSFWIIRSHVRLGLEKLERINESDGYHLTDPAIRSAALSCASELALTASDFSLSRSLSEQSLKLCEEHGLEEQTARTFCDLGRVAFEQGEYDLAEDFSTKALVRLINVGDLHGAATALNTLGLVGCEQGNYDEAIGRYRVSLDLARRLGDQRNIAGRLNNLGVVYRRQGNYQDAKAVFKEATDIQLRLGNRRGVGITLSNLGLIAEHEQDYDEARRLQEESLAVRREIGDDWGIARSLAILGIMARHQGDLRLAENLFNENLTLCRRMGNRLGIAQTLCNLGDVYTESKRFVSAHEHLSESLELMTHLANRQGLADVLQAYSRLAFGLGEHEQSARLFIFAQKLLSEIGAQLPPSERGATDEHRKALLTSLGAQRFSRIQDTVNDLKIEDAIVLAKDIKPGL